MRQENFCNGKTIFVYDGGGQLVAEYSTVVAPPATAQVSYLTADHLGSARVITDQNGAVTTRKDYLAFGDEASSAQRTANPNYDTSETRKGYTGYEKDSESGLEFAQARYYNSQHGRFTSIDPLTASASIKNPQTFNRYSYVLNSPYKFVDPLGLISQNTGAYGSAGDCPAGYSSCYDSGDSGGFAQAVPESHSDEAATAPATATPEVASQPQAEGPAPPPQPTAEQNAEQQQQTQDEKNISTLNKKVDDLFGKNSETQSGIVVNIPDKKFVGALKDLIEYYYNMGKIVGAMIESIAKMIPNESLEGDEAIITPKGNDPGQSNWTEKRIQGKALRLLIGDIEASLNNEIQLKALEVLREQQIETRGKDKSGKTVHFTYDVIGNSYYVTELLKAAKDLGKASR